MSKCEMAQNTMYTKNYRSVSLILSISTKTIVLMGWGPVRSSQNTSHDQISDKNHYIYQIGAIRSK